MCGRFILITDLSVIASDFNVQEVSLSFSPSRDVRPGQHIPAVLHVDGRNIMASYVWGLIPFWAKDPSLGAKLINARAETVAQKPSFKNAFAKRRCLIPADGFYEWKKEGNKKIPYSFYMKSGQPFVFAGLYETWIAPDKKQVNTCTIITTEANRLVSPIHDRMPVIVPMDKTAVWLSPAGKEPSGLSDILKPYPPELMECRPVRFE